MALYSDGTPKSLTVWIPLTNATPLNGCMYIIPANRDKTYNTSDENEWKFDYPDVRALPGQAGNVFVWNQAVLHWGSRTSRFAEEPRISVAFEFQRADVPPFNQPLLNPKHLPSFEARLKLIAKQLLQYKHMYPLSPAMEQFSQNVLIA
jgi:ectoine hydroxylase-related dioxygenase (phytanoyl-CoA dioxygenase family)